MTKLYLKLCAALFSVAVLVAVTYGIIYACAGGDWDEADWASDFTPEAYVGDAYKPLFYAPEVVFYNIGFDTEHIKRFNDTSLNDWSDYLKGKLTADQVAALLLNDEKGAAIGQLYSALQQKKQPAAPYASLNLGDEKVKGFVTFMHLAKQIESASTFSFDYWDYEAAKKAPVLNASVVAQAERLYTETSDSFRKNRYWFQAVKAHFYSGNRQNVIGFFERTQRDVPRNTLYYRAVAYVAGAQYKAKNYTVSNYLYSVVFHGCPELRTMAAYNFHPQEQADFQAALALAKSADEKAALWALFGYYADEVVAIREIYSLNPKSEHLDYLLTRLVNKEEGRLNGQQFSSAEAYRAHVKTKSNKEALQVVSTIAREGKVSTPHLWNLAAGYLNVFAGNYTQASQLFDKVEKQSPRSDLASDQLRILRLVNTLHSTTKMTAALETTLLGELDWLYNGKHTDETLRYYHASTWSKQYISSLYRQQGNVVYGELFNRDKTFYHKASNLEAMKTFLSVKTRTPFELLAERLYDVTLTDIYDYQGILSAYAGKLDESIALFEAGKAGQAQLQGNPFNGRIKDCHDCDHAAVQKVTYTKLSFIQKLKEMKALVDKGQDVYNNSLLLGNAYYNMTFFGNARAFYYNKIIDEYGIYIGDYYAPQLLHCTTADRYYKMAFAAATTDEQRAKCAYMMAKCERNEKFKGDPSTESLAWDGFVQLKTKYKHTKYYREVLNECGYFTIYLNQ